MLQRIYEDGSWIIIATLVGIIVIPILQNRIIDFIASVISGENEIIDEINNAVKRGFNDGKKFARKEKFPRN